MTPLANQAIIAVAGSGKTTTIVREALSNPQKGIAVVTYTRNNENEIRTKFYELHGAIPANVTICTWFSFLLNECVRPYQNYVYDAMRIDSIAFINGRSSPYIKKMDAAKYFFSEGRNIYTDKISAFACQCQQNSGGKLTSRLSQIYDEIYIDEVQDMAGYDLELIEILLKSPIRILLVGDHRQATYSTNNSAKNSGFSRTKIVNKLKGWEKKNLCKIDYLTDSYRCNQAICDFADQLFMGEIKTKSYNHSKTGHDGVFLVPENALEEYVALYKPITLRYNKTINTLGYSAMNFGESKGLTFDRVLIFPNNPIKKFLLSGDLSKIGDIAKFYVAVTRARYSVAIVYAGKCLVQHVQQFIKPSSPQQASLFASIL
jgi:DNA helicase-2/ATP-dependent DNA helicase PcrA